MRKCGNCKFAEIASDQEIADLGRGARFIWCKATGPKISGGGGTTFPAMKFSGSCALHKFSLRKLLQGDGARA
jgi:hypothetical protein